MEQTGINLLPQLTEEEIKKGVYRRKANVLALGFLGIVGLIIVALIIFQIVLSFSANDIKTRTSQAEDSIASHRDVEITSLALSQKIDKIKQILTSEIPVSTLVQQVGVAVATPAPITLSSLSATADGELQVEGTAADSTTFGAWIDNLTSDVGKEYFDKINLVNLTRGTDGYKFSFRMNFLKKGVYQPQ